MSSRGEPSPAPEATTAPSLARLRARLAEPDEGAGRPARLGRFLGRLVWVAARAFFRDRVQLRASALSFSTLLAVVPSLALAFALARGTGLYATFRAGTIDPFLDETLGRGGEGVQTLRTWADGVLALVEATDLSGLGVGGFAVLALALVRVLLGVEEAFRQIFAVKGARRTLGGRLSALGAVAVLSPLGLLYATASASLHQGTWLSARLAAWVPLGPLRELLLVALPPLVVLLALHVVYRALPEVPVPRRSALFGAAWAAALWYGTQLAHVRLQLGLARWNALYSGFGAFPVLLASIQLSWVAVLIGAQLAAAHRQDPSLRGPLRGGTK